MNKIDWPSNIMTNPDLDMFTETKETSYDPVYWGILTRISHGKDPFSFKVMVSADIDPLRKNLLALRVKFFNEFFSKGAVHIYTGDKEIKPEIIPSGTIVHYSKDEIKDRGYKDSPEGNLEHFVQTPANLKKLSGSSYTKAEIVTQYPLNFFKDGAKAELNRIFPKYWVDILAKSETALDIFELKIAGNDPFDLLAQGMDYLMLAHYYRQHIADFFESKNIEKIRLFYVAEKYHLQFGSVFKILKDRLSAHGLEIFMKEVKFQVKFDILEGHCEH